MSDAANNLGMCGSRLAVQGRAILAPMAGVTDLGMRRLAQRFGAAFTVSEMIVSNRFAQGDLANQIKAEGRGLGFQPCKLLDASPTQWRRWARRAQDLGASMLDINVGCPVKKVTGGYAGSHLMRDLGLAVSLIRAAVAAVQIPVTLKIRLGWDIRSINAPELVRLAEAEGIAMLSVHGRTRCQFYAATADWRSDRQGETGGFHSRRREWRLRESRRCGGDARAIRDRRGDNRPCRDGAAMVPWRCGLLSLSWKSPRHPPSAERKNAALEHFETLLEIYGTGRGLRHARKHLAAYAERVGSRIGAELRKRLVGLNCPKAVRSILCELFDSPLKMEVA